jgi:hypothetical protein
MRRAATKEEFEPPRRTDAEKKEAEFNAPPH